METFDLTQTGAQVQDILDKAAQLPSKATLDTELNAKADKSNTYTKAEVDQLVQTLENGSYERVDTYEDLGDPTEEKAGIIWLVGAEDAEEFERYIVGHNGDNLEWVYMGTTAVDLTGKADKVADAVDGDLAGLDGDGNLTDSGYKPADFATAAQGAKADAAYQLPGSGIPEEDLSTPVQNALGRINNKADKVGSGHTNKLAAYNSAGNLKDSGIGIEDVALKASSNPAMLVGSALGILGNTPQAALYTHRAVPAGAGSGAAQMRLLRGKSIVINQVVPALSVATTQNGITFAPQSDGSIDVDGTASADATLYLGSQLTLLAGHTYLIRGCPAGGAWETYWFADAIAGYIRDTGAGELKAVTSDTAISPAIKVRSGVTLSHAKFYPQLIDITRSALTGITSVADFAALYPHPIAYNSGSILNLMATGIKTVGFNLWDEEWEIGHISYQDGENTVDGNAMRSKNYIPVFGGQTYRFTNRFYANTGAVFAIRLYDANKQFRQYALDVRWNNSYELPEWASYVRFVNLGLGSGYGTTYRHDICINISNPARNGQYEPYRSCTMPLPITTMTGKAGGVGDSVTIYPDGMMSAGTAYDYGRVDADGWLRKTQKVVAMVNLGDCTWTYDADNVRFTTSINLPSGRAADSTMVAISAAFGIVTDAYLRTNPTTDKIAAFGSSILSVRNLSYTDPTAFRTAMDGVSIVYLLATPVEYTLDTPIYMGYPVDADGTETMQPDQAGLSEPTSAPIDYDVVYPIDLAGNLVTELNAMLTENSLAGSFAKNGNGGVTYSAE